MRLLILTIISNVFIATAQDSITKEDFFKSGICLSGDCKIDYGIKKFNDGTVYFGSWWNDLPSGQGTIIWSDGTIYVGNFLEGEYHGDGTYMTPQQFYIGEFKNDIANGNGSFLLLTEYTWVSFTMVFMTEKDFSLIEMEKLVRGNTSREIL